MRFTIFLIALSIMTIAFSPQVGGLLGKSEFIDSYLDRKAEGLVSENIDKIADGTEHRLLQNIPIPDELETALQNRDAVIIKSEQMQLYLKNALKDLFIYAVAVVLTMGASVVILLILNSIINKIVKTPKAKTIDRVMGFFLGALEGLIGVWIVLSLLHLIDFWEIPGNILQSVHTSPLLSVVDDCNLIYLAARHVMGLK
ncbi:MAG: CvpA family protein [Eubacteriales bacterium]